MKQILERIRDKAGRLKIDFMDIRVFEEENTDIVLQDARADKINHEKSSAAGIRVLINGVWGFASTDRLDFVSLDNCLEAASGIARASRSRVVHPGVITQIESVIDCVSAQVEIDPRSISLCEKVRRVVEYEKAGIAFAPEKLCNTLVGYGDIWSRETVCNTEGTFIEQEIIRTSLWASITAQEGSVRQMSHTILNSQGGFELLERTAASDFTEETARKAVALLSAQRMPSGKFPVVLHPSVSGLLVHEALGHNAEADLVFCGDSILEGKLNQPIGSPLVTILDDATIPGGYGSYRYDSEGTPGQKRILVEKGILKGFMHSLETAARFGIPPNGSARAMNGHHVPIVRMSNTCFAAGDHSVEELIRDVNQGIYMKGGNGGYVMCDRGQYTCFVGEGWMIRNGELCEHLRDVAFSGMILETLMNIDAVGRDMEFVEAGMCGKGGQGMHVDLGGPHLRIKEVVIGGQE